MFLRDLFKWGKLIDSGVVHEDIKAAQGFSRLREKAIDLRPLREICLNGDRLSTPASNFGDDSVRIAFARMKVDDDSRSFTGQMLCDRSTNPFGCAGNQCNFAAQFSVRVFVVHNFLPFTLFPWFKSCLLSNKMPTCLAFYLFNSVHRS